MWVNLAQLVRDRVADRKGNTLPADVSGVTYEVKDLAPAGVGLMVNSLATDTSYGFNSFPPTPSCCGYSGVVFDPEEIAFLEQNNEAVWIFGTNQCNGQIDPLSGDFPGSSWGTTDSSVAQLTYGNAKGVGVGAAGGFASGDVPTGEGVFCPMEPQRPTLPITVRPAITGPNTVWWFNGQTPTGYATTVTLTASGGSSYSWSITKGSNMISLSSKTGSSVTVSSTGSAFSSTTTDISVTVTSNQASSAPFYLTSRRPYTLVVGTVIYQCDTTWGYDDYFNYTIKDQMGTALPSVIPLNEYWTTAVVNDYSGTNWRPATAGRYTTESGSPAEFADEIQGENVNLPPNPPTACPGAGRAVQHWGQEWFVGSLTSGSGAAVQTDTIQKYTNDAQIQNITSPVP